MIAKNKLMWYNVIGPEVGTPMLLALWVAYWVNI